MQVGVVLPIALEEGMSVVPSYAECREIAVGAESLGFDSVWVFDHFLFEEPDGSRTGLHESWTILAAIAEATRRVQLGTLVLGTEFRNPALTAKMAATLDHISDGRLILGLGCGWNDPEYVAFGYPTDHKVSRFEDSLETIAGLLRGGRVSHDGSFHSVVDAELLPPARPDVPILIAAKGPRMLDLTVRHANAWNTAWFGLPNERLATRRADLAAALERAGRDPATMTITVGLEVRYPDLSPGPEDSVGLSRGPLTGSAAEVAAGLRAHAEAGADHVIVSLDPTTPEALGRLAEAMAVFRAG